MKLKGKRARHARRRRQGDPATMQRFLDYLTGQTWTIDGGLSMQWGGA